MNWEFLYHVKNSGDIHLLFFALMVAFLVVHIVWEIIKTGSFRPSAWGDKAKVVAAAFTLATGVLLVQCYFHSDVFNLIGQAGLASTLVVAGFVNIITGLKSLEP